MTLPPLFSLFLMAPYIHRGPWLRVLPRQLSSPVFWSEDEYQELEGSNLHEICAGISTYICGHVEREGERTSI